MLTATALPPSLACAPVAIVARVLPARLLDRRPEFVAQPLARHGEQIAAGLARGHLQIAVGRSRVIQALVLAVDQDRSGRIGLEQHPLREVASADALRRRRAASGLAKAFARPLPGRSENRLRQAGCDRSADRSVASWRSARTGRPACPPSRSRRASERRPRGARNGIAEGPFPAPRGANRSAGYGRRSGRGGRTARRPTRPAW